MPAPASAIHCGLSLISAQDSPMSAPHVIARATLLIAFSLASVGLDPRLPISACGAAEP